MPHQFADRTDAVEFLASQLRLGPFATCAVPLAEQTIDEWGLSAQKSDTESSHRAVFRPTRWVIRDQDLGLFDMLSGVLHGTATGAVLFASTGSVSISLLSPIVVVVSHLLKLAQNVQKKGAQLDEREFFLMTLILEAPTGIMVEVLSAKWATRFGEETIGEVEPLLNRLAKYPTPVGELALIWKSSDCRWLPKDL